MLKKILLPTLFILTAFLAVLVQLSLIFPLESSISHFNLVLLLLTAILFFLNLRWAVVSAVSAGVFIDLLSFNFFSLHSIVLIVTLVFANRLLSSWLTNRSLYSLVSLVAATNLIYSLIRSSLLYLTDFNQENLFILKVSFWSGLAYQILWSVLAALILFIAVGALMRRFRPVFLDNE